MKKIMFYATVVAMSLAMAMPAQAQTRKDKKAAEKEQWEREQRQKAEEEELRHQMKMDSLRNAATPKVDRKAQLQEEAEMAQLEAEMEIAKLKAANAKKAIAARLGQKIYMPCIEEGYDKPGEYMAGYGVAEGEAERGPGIINANKYAVAEIASKYVGMIKNGVSQYTKNVNTRSGNKVKENELEGAAEAIGTKLIEKYSNAICREAEWADDGTYTCYVAVHVPLKEVLDATVDEIGVIQTDLDRKKFREYMQEELDRQAAAAQAEKEEVIKLRQEAGL